MKNLLLKYPGVKNSLIYLLMMTLGVIAGLDKIPGLKNVGLVVGEFFVGCFKCISMPVIFFSLVVTFLNYRSTGLMQKIWRNTLKYTFGTTCFAAILAYCLFLIIHPQKMVVGEQVVGLQTAPLPQSFVGYLMHLVPSNFLQPFLENQVLTVLLLALLLGAAIRKIPEDHNRQTIANFFRGCHDILVVLTKWLLRWIPVAMFGFMTATVESLHAQRSLLGLGEYLAVVVLANLIQGLVVLPLWLKWQGFKPYAIFKSLTPALSVAFFSKSSVGTLPVTMDTVEQRLNISPEITRFVLPLCTSINMNGCAAFIFTTVVYLMQNAGWILTPWTLLPWIFIATIAAIGNAGVPMGCFFLSLSLLVSMNVPIPLMGLILPFYTLIDMLETALNVWSDCCVVNAVARDAAEFC